MFHTKKLFFQNNKTLNLRELLFQKLLLSCVVEFLEKEYHTYNSRTISRFSIIVLHYIFQPFFIIIFKYNKRETIIQSSLKMV